MSSGRYPISDVIVEEEWANSTLPIHYKEKYDISLVSHREMKGLSQLSTPTPVLLVCEIPSQRVNNALNTMNRLVYLDRVQDPGNVGTIIRVADWFGCDAVIRGNGTADFFNAKVVQSSMGSMCGVELISSDFADVAEGIPEHEVWIADMSGQSVREVTPPKKWLLVIGNEGSGVDSRIKEGNVKNVCIPGCSQKIAESLNAAISAGIILSYFNPMN